ncbi:hypothetical protein ACJX0J_030165, partial [Zea mays]
MEVIILFLTGSVNLLTGHTIMGKDQGRIHFLEQILCNIYYSLYHTGHVLFIWHGMFLFLLVTFLPAFTCNVVVIDLVANFLDIMLLVSKRKVLALLEICFL